MDFKTFLAFNLSFKLYFKLLLIPNNNNNNNNNENDKIKPKTKAKTKGNIPIFIVYEI